MGRWTRTQWTGTRSPSRNCWSADGMRCPLPIASPRWRPPSTRRAPGAAAWPSPTTRTSTSPPGSFPRRCAPISTPSTPIAASRTTSATRLAPRPRPSPCSTFGAANSTPATRATRAIRSLWPWLRPFAPAPSPSSPLPTCWSPFARTRPSPASKPCGTCSPTAITRPTPSAAWCSTPAASRAKSISASLT